MSLFYYPRRHDEMDFFFNPRGIALIGATPNPQKGGHAILRNLRIGFKGGIYPVNPSYTEIEGMSCYPSILEVPDPVDLGIIFVPAPLVPKVVQECARRQIPGVMIESGGFAETGKSGAILQEAIKSIAQESGIRLWGPNCMGLVDTVKGHIFSFVAPSIWDQGLKQGKVSMIAQSGMLSGAFLIDVMTHGITGVSKVCSIGNKVDVNECDILEYLIADNHTEAVCLYLESIDDGRRLVRLCKNTSKPIILLKGGKSKKGASAAMSHTASLSVNNAVLRGAMAQAGVFEATGFRHMMDLGRTLARYPKPQTQIPGKIAVLAYSGGAGIVSSDFIDSMGLELAELSRTTLYQLKTITPEWMPLSNPVDLWPAVERNGARKTFGTAMRAVCSDSGVDGVLFHAFTGGFALNPDMAEIVRISRSAGKPLFCWLLGEREAARDFQERTQDLGIPVFRDLHRAVECMAAVFRKKSAALEISETKQPEKPILSETLENTLTNKGGLIDEYVSKHILSAYGIPTVIEKVVIDEKEALAVAAELGFPIVMKGLLPGQAHKTESGLVRIGIKTEKEVSDAFGFFYKKTIENKTDGKIIIQRQLPESIEMIAGLIHDPQFGNCVMCGFGGIFTEIIGDSEFAVAPIGMPEALDLINRLKNQKLLDGFRSFPAVDRTQLASILVNLGQIGLDYPQIKEIDINPLLTGNQGLVAVDALIVLKNHNF
jgi:acetate---CoA ligase (ADP-forming)